MEDGRWRMEEGEAWVVNGISCVVAGDRPWSRAVRSATRSVPLLAGRRGWHPGGRESTNRRCRCLSTHVALPGSASGTGPLQGGDVGLTVSPDKCASTHSKAPRQSPSLSPRKGRPRADRREVIPWRGVESLQHQSSIPVPHRPTLPVPAKAEIPFQIEVRDRPSPERGSGPDRRRSMPRRARTRWMEDGEAWIVDGAL
jgi:hypothetical protein